MTAGDRPSPSEDVTVRPGVPEDGEALGELATAARLAAVPMMPPPVHTPEEDRAWILRQLAGEREVWVAETRGALAGYVLLEPGWLHSLYVRPDLTGQGIGSLLLDFVKALRPDGFSLWVFVTNEGARRFYRRHGLVELRRTDGADNDEHAPNIEMAWLGQDPAAALRGRLDALDERIAELSVQRAALALLLDGPHRPGSDPGHREA